MTCELDQTILQRNSIKDATHVDESNGLKFLLLQHTRHIWCGVCWGTTSHDFSGLTPITKPITSMQTIKVKGLEDLIGGTVALQAVLNGQTVQLSLEPWEEKHWDDFIPGIDETSTKAFFTEFHGEQKVFFRIKPKTININGIEVPAPMNRPVNIDEEFFYIDTDGFDGNIYLSSIFKFDVAQPIYWWPTEEKIKIVACALRNIFEVKHDR